MNLKRIIVPALFLTIITVGCNKDDNDTATTGTQSGNWIRRSDLDGNARTEAASFVVNDKAYITTGFGANGVRLKDTWAYDVDLNSWGQQLADFTGPVRNSAVGFAIGSKGYVGTGYDGTKSLKDFYEYDPATNMWTAKADFAGSARYDAVGFGIGSKGYITTGFDGNALKDMYSYDATTNTWTPEIGMGGTKRSQAVVFVHNNKAYVTTGINNGTPVNDLFVFDPAATGAAKWTEKRKIANISTESYDDNYNIMRANAVAMVIGDKAFISTGENNAFLKTTWVYDIANDTWTEKSPFEGVERSGAVAFALKGKGFITTGRNNTFYFDDLYQFLPDETLNTTD